MLVVAVLLAWLGAGCDITRAASPAGSSGPGALVVAVEPDPTSLPTTSPPENPTSPPAPTRTR